MGLIQGLKSTVSFLTVIPIKTLDNGLEGASNYIILFPLVGAFIGFLGGGLAWILGRIFPSSIMGFLTIGFILLITGLHHTDGLLDFGDALMFQGSSAEKLRVMHDHHTGAGGFGLGVIVISVTGLCIGSLNTSIVIQTLIASEVIAKFSMVLTAFAGVPASGGSGKQFINALHEKNKNITIITALFVTIIICALLLGVLGVLGIAVATAVSLVIIQISLRQFKVITGDVFGAVNEITRMVSMLIVIGGLKWV